MNHKSINLIEFIVLQTCLK
uniref:Uncharacterized protein n=1 Tax=Arundo donax TaxID=35708 RepID=A0A0A9FRP2_ARUDO